LAIEDLPDGFITFTRDELVEKYKRDLLLRNPGADVTSGQPDLDARLIADQLLPVYSDARLIVDGINEDAAVGIRLDRVGARISLPRRGASGSSGFVAVQASAGGGTIEEGRELTNRSTRYRYEAAETKHVNNGDAIRIRALDTGPNTDVAPGVVLQWEDPPPGIGQYATVNQQSGGRGLTGGAAEENDARYLERIRAKKKNPAAGDNDAEVAEVLMETPGVPIEQVFTYPGFWGPSSHGYTFTVLPSRLGASRIPTLAQLQAAHAWLVAQMPGDHGYFPLDIVAQDLIVRLTVQWSTESPGWADVTPWPKTTDNVAGVQINVATSPTAFVLGLSNVAPVVGQTIALYDKANLRFVRKRLLTVSGALPGPYTVTCDTTNGASDTTYTPIVGQKVSPWSDSMDAPLEPLFTYLGTLGPGEAFVFGTNAPEDGRRRHRVPRPPKSYPFSTSARLLVGIAALNEVFDVNDVDGAAETVTAGIMPKMLELSDLAFYGS
jgi:uncharacterized phage protein gp47/JayE